jgi:hypothetical protein
MLLWSIKYQHGDQPIPLHSLYDNRIIADMSNLYVGHHNTSTGIKTLKYIKYITRRTFTVCLLFVMFFMSVLVDTHLVKISGCAKNMVPFRSFIGDIMMEVKTCGSQRHCTGLWPLYSYVCICLLLLIELQLLNWFCVHNESPAFTLLIPNRNQTITLGLQELITTHKKSNDALWTLLLFTIEQGCPSHTWSYIR